MQDAASGKRQQQCDAETVFVGADELAVHLVDEYPRNVQPQTAAVLARGICLSSVEFIRNQVDFILRYAHTAVCNLHLQKAVLRPAADLNFRACIFIGIADEIAEDLRKPHRIHADHAVRDLLHAHKLLRVVLIQKRANQRRRLVLTLNLHFVQIVQRGRKFVPVKCESRQ